MVSRMYQTKLISDLLPSNGGLAAHKAHNHAWSSFTITIDGENSENAAGTRSAMSSSTTATYGVARVNAQLARMWYAKDGDANHIDTLWDAAQDAYTRATTIPTKIYDSSDSPGPAFGGGDYPDSQVSDDKYAASLKCILPPSLSESLMLEITKTFNRWDNGIGQQ